MINKNVFINMRIKLENYTKIQKDLNNFIGQKVNNQNCKNINDNHSKNAEKRRELIYVIGNYNCYTNILKNKG